MDTEQVQARMDRIKEADMAYAKSRPFSDGNGCVGGVSQEAVMGAVAKYGPEVMTGAGKGFWDDQYRAYPWLRPNKKPPGTDSINGRRGKFGNVSWKRTAEGWFRWDAESGCWVKGKGPVSKLRFD